MAIKTCGRFTLEEDGSLYGPTTYMEAQGNTLVDCMLAGEDVIFNLTCHQSADAETAILVRLQTDYAGWLGLKQTESWLNDEPKS